MATIRRVMFLTAVLCGCVGHTVLRAQVPPPGVAGVDTVTVFTKAYVARIRGNVSSVYMGQELNGILRMPRGWYFTGRLAMDESYYRLQDRRDERRNLTGNLSMPLGPRILLTGALAHNGFFNRVVTSSGEAQNFKNDTQRAEMHDVINKTLEVYGKNVEARLLGALARMHRR